MPEITDLACQVLRASSPQEKVEKANELSAHWLSGNACVDSALAAAAPTTPGKPNKPELVPFSEVKRRRLGSEQGRIALLHAIAHIEFNAINLAADMVARFAYDTRIADGDRHKFISDWVQVCADEARHFGMIEARLSELGSHYGAHTAHNGLWEAAVSTMNDVAARLAIAPMVLEARGLDVTPGMIEKLTSAGDTQSADIFQIIYDEEIAHVAAGAHWFHHICARESRDPQAYFKNLVKTHYKGNLKPPFNVAARTKAGLPAEFYQSAPAKFTA